MGDTTKAITLKMQILIMTLIVGTLFTVFGSAISYVANDYIDAVGSNTVAVKDFHEFVDSVLHVAPWELKDRQRMESNLTAKIMDIERRVAKLEGE